MEPPEPSTGDVEVAASTTGEDIDPDGYTVTVAGDDPQSLEPNGSVTIEGVSTGETTVELSGVADNCSVDGENPKTVEVSGGNTISATFDITCNARAGDARVTTSTSGSDQDSDGYTVTVDPGSGGPSQSIDTGGEVVFSGLAEGEHEFELSGVANNCSVDGENPRTVSVPFDGTAEVTFEVTCSDAVGDLEVSASTSGQDPDTDGYEVVVDGTQTESIGPDGSVTFEGLAAGTRSVELTGVAANCSVDGQNPRDVDVPNGGTASEGFSVNCSDALGGVEVTTATTGEDQDDGYTITVDPGTSDELSRDVGAEETTTFTNLDAGDHQVELGDVADNCSVGGDNPRTVTVPNRDTVATTFDVDCTSTVGDLEVSASTSGEDVDQDGYEVTLNPGSSSPQSQSIGVDGTVTFPDVSSDEHTVELTGLRGNCSVTGDNPRMVTVPGGGTESTTFDVTCENREGDLEVTASTEGDDLDPDGYTITVDPETPNAHTQPIGIDETITITEIDEGDHEVELTGNEDNCTVTTANPDSVSVPFEGTASITFEVSCWVPLDNEIVFESDRDDPGGNRSIYVMNPDGTGVQRLTDLSFDDSNPHVSPDGRRIVFQSDRGGAGPEIWLMNPDGSGVEKLLDITFNGFNPQWSPATPPGADTTQIAFVRGGAERDIWVVDADGADRQQLASTSDCDDLPTWSPDAVHIAYTSTSGSCFDADTDILVRPADGSGTPAQVTTEPGFDGNASWAEQSDGTNFIVFSTARDGDEEVYRLTVDADGTNATNPTNLTESSGSGDGFASWKPDGTAIVFSSDRDGQDDLFIMNPDGSGQTKITDDPGMDQAPAWSPSP